MGRAQFTQVYATIYFYIIFSLPKMCTLDFLPLRLGGCLSLVSLGRTIFIFLNGCPNVATSMMVWSVNRFTTPVESLYPIDYQIDRPKSVRTRSIIERYLVSFLYCL